MSDWAVAAISAGAALLGSTVPAMIAEARQDRRHQREREAAERAAYAQLLDDTIAVVNTTTQNLLEALEVGLKKVLVGTYNAKSFGEIVATLAGQAARFRASDPVSAALQQYAVEAEVALRGGMDGTKLGTVLADVNRAICEARERC